jgi:hypothetical protein
LLLRGDGDSIWRGAGGWWVVVVAARRRDERGPGSRRGRLASCLVAGGVVRWHWQSDSRQRTDRPRRLLADKDGWFLLGFSFRIAEA